MVSNERIIVKQLTWKLRKEAVAVCSCSCYPDFLCSCWEEEHEMSGYRYSRGISNCKSPLYNI